MANDITKNDWLVANMSSPNNTLGDFAQEGLTSFNTQLLSKEDYIKNKDIQSRFITKDDKFDNQAFDNYYDGVLQTYNQFANKNFENSVLNNVYFNQSDSRIQGADIKRLGSTFKTDKVMNPMGTKKGVMGMFEESENDLSVRERAQTQKIWSNKKQKFEDFSANDLWVKSFFTKDTHAIATFKEDGQHYDPLSGRMVKHNKGEYRTNDAGQYFYEDLNGDTPYGREILSPFDVLTTDGSAANKYDFFDSDSKTKSITGTVFKTAAFTLPYLIPGVGNIYAGITATSMLATQVLPALTKATAGMFVDNFDATETGRFMNMLEAKGKAFQSSASDRDREKMLTINNIVGMAGDVFGQLAQQQVVAKIPSYLGLQAKKLGMVDDFLKTAAPAEAAAFKTAMSQAKDLQQKHGVIRQFLGKSGKYEDLLNGLDKSITDWGMNMGKAYMTMISSSGAYEEALAQGLNGLDAAMFYFGTTAALGAIMSQDYLNIALTRGIGLDEIAGYSKNVVKNEAGRVMATTESLMKAGSKNLATIAKEGAEEVVEEVAEAGIKGGGRANLIKWFSKGKAVGNKLKESLLDLGNPTLTKDMLLEAAEEISEEAAQDAVKLGYNALRAIGVTSTDAEDTKAFGFDNFLDRYMLSGLGGAIGGGIHFLKNGGASSSLPKSLEKDLTSLLLHGYETEVLESLNKMHKEGQLGSTELSSELAEVGFKLDDNPVFKPAGGNLPSQNDVVYELLKNRIKFIKDSVFQESGLRDGNLFNLYNQRASKLSEEFKYFTAIEDDMESLANDIVSIKTDIANFADTVDPADQENSKIALQEKHKELETKREELKALVNGDKYEDYVKETLFAVHDDLFQTFGVKSKDDMSRSMFEGKPYAELSAEERSEVDESYSDYEKQDRKVQVRAGMRELDYMLGETYKDLTDLKAYVEEGKKIQDLGLDADLTQVLSYISRTEEGKKYLAGLQGQTAAELLTGLAEVTKEVNPETGESTDLAVAQDHSDLNKVKLINEYLTNVKYVDPTLKRLVQNTFERKLLKSNVLKEDGKTSINYNNVINSLNSIDAYNHPDIYTDNSAVANLIVRDIFNTDLKDLENLNVWTHSNELTKIIDNYKANFSNVNAIVEKANEWLDNGKVDYNLTIEPEEDEDGGIIDDGTDWEALKESKRADFQAYVNDYVRNIEKFLTTLSKDSLFVFDDVTKTLVPVNSTLHSDLESVKTKLETSKANPVIALTDRLLKNVKNSDGVKNLIGLVSGEINNLASKQLADQYIIDRPSVRWELEKAKDALLKVKTLVTAATDFQDLAVLDENQLSYTSALSASMSKGTIDPVDLPTFTLAEAEVLNRDLYKFESRINNLLDLHTYNSNGNIRVQRTVGNKMLTMYSSIFDKDGFGIKALQNIGIATEELEDLVGASENLQVGFATLNDQISDPNASLIFDGSENFAEKARLESDKISQKIYELIQAQSDPVATLNALLNNFKNLDVKPDQLTDYDINTKTLTDAQKAMFLMMSASVDPKRFYSDFAGDLSQADNTLSTSKYAPFYGQELAAKFAYWSIVSKFTTQDTFKETADVLLPNNFEADNLKNRIPSIKAGLFVFGIPGTGKTTAIASTISKIAKSYGLKVAAYAPFDEQSKNLIGNIGTDNIINKEGTVKSLIENIIGEETASELYSALTKVRINAPEDMVYLDMHRDEANPENDFDVVKLNVNHPKIQEVLENTISINGLTPEVIVIDEITQVPGPAVQLLDLIIQKYNEKVDRKITMLYLGDVEQNGYTTDVDYQNASHVVSASIANYNILTTPVLSQSLRSDYNVNNANIAKIRSFTKAVIADLQDSMHNEAKFKIEQGVNFDFVEKDRQLIGYKATNVIEPEDVIKILNYVNVNEELGTVVYISALTAAEIEKLKSKLQSLGATEDALARLTFTTPAEVQGREFDYSIIDTVTPSSLSITGESNSVNEFKKMMRNINTLLTRSKVGSLFTTSLQGSTVLSSSDDNVISQKVDLDVKTIGDFKDFTIRSISNAFNNLKDLDSNINQTPAANTTTTTVVPISDEDFKEGVKSVIASNMSSESENEYKNVTGYKGPYGTTANLNPSEKRITNYSWHTNLGYDTDDKNKVILDIKKDDVRYNSETLNSNTNYIYKTLFNSDPSGVIAGTKADDPVRRATKLYINLKNNILGFYQNGLNGKLISYLDRHMDTDSDYEALRPSIKNIDDFKLAIVTKKYDEQFDKDVANTDYGRNPENTKNGELISYVALVSSSVDNNGVPDVILTLSAFGNPENQIVQQQLPNVVQSFRDLAKKHNEFIVGNSLSPYSRSIYTLDSGKKKADVLKATTNLNFRKNVTLNVDEKGNSFQTVKEITAEEFDRISPHLSKSEPFIITDDILSDLNLTPEQIEDAGLSQLKRFGNDGKNGKTFNLKGYVGRFVSSDKSIDSLESFLIKFKDELQNVKISGNYIPGKVRLQILRPVGKTLTKMLEENTKFAKQLGDESTKSSVNIIESNMYTNDYAAAMILARLINISSTDRNGNLFLPNSIQNKLSFLNSVDYLVNMTSGMLFGTDVTHVLKGSKADKENEKVPLAGRLQDYLHTNRSEIAAIKKNYYDTTDKQSFIYAQEHFIARDLLKYMKQYGPQSVKKARQIIDGLEIDVDSPFDKRAVYKVFSALRVAINGGKFTDAAGNTTSVPAIMSANKYTEFLKDLEAVITGEPEDLNKSFQDKVNSTNYKNYRPLFPDGIHLNIFSKKGKGYLASEENGIKPAVGELTDFVMDYKMLMPNMLIDQSDFNTPLGNNATTNIPNVSTPGTSPAPTPEEVLELQVRDAVQAVSIAPLSYEPIMYRNNAYNNIYVEKIKDAITTMSDDMISGKLPIVNNNPLQMFEEVRDKILSENRNDIMVYEAGSLKHYNGLDTVELMPDVLSEVGEPIVILTPTKYLSKGGIKNISGLEGKTGHFIADGSAFVWTVKNPIGATLGTFNYDNGIMSFKAAKDDTSAPTIKYQDLVLQAKDKIVTVITALTINDIALNGHTAEIISAFEDALIKKITPSMEHKDVISLLNDMSSEILNDFYSRNKTTAVYQTDNGVRVSYSNKEFVDLNKRLDKLLKDKGLVETYTYSLKPSSLQKNNDVAHQLQLHSEKAKGEKFDSEFTIWAKNKYSNTPIEIKGRVNNIGSLYLTVVDPKAATPAKDIVTELEDGTQQVLLSADVIDDYRNYVNAVFDSQYDSVVKSEEASLSRSIPGKDVYTELKNYFNSTAMKDITLPDGQVIKVIATQDVQEITPEVLQNLKDALEADVYNNFMLGDFFTYFDEQGSPIVEVTDGKQLKANTGLIGGQATVDIDALVRSSTDELKDKALTYELAITSDVVKNNDGSVTFKDLKNNNTDSINVPINILENNQNIGRFVIEVEIPKGDSDTVPTHKVSGLKLNTNAEDAIYNRIPEATTTNLGTGLDLNVMKVLQQIDHPTVKGFITDLSSALKGDKISVDMQRGLSKGYLASQFYLKSQGDTQAIQELKDLYKKLTVKCN